MSTVIQPQPRPGARRLRSVARALASVVAPPQALAFWARQVAPGASAAHARVVERRQEAIDAVTLVLQPGRGWGGFEPGQHLNIGCEVDGRRVQRSYSLSDLPRADGRIAITVRRVAGGKLSRHLCEATGVGDWLDISPAFGEMTLANRADVPRVFLAAGSGITPLMSMTRALAARGMPAPLTLLYWARHRDDLCFVEELRAFDRRFANFSMAFLLTGDAAAADDERHGRIDTELLATQVPDLGTRAVFACGPAAFVDAARTHAAATALTFSSEAFTPPSMAHGVDDADVAGTVEVTLAKSQRTLTLACGTSLLDALEAAGVTPASGCRMGICNSCACGKRTGSTRHLHTGEVEHEPVTALRLCVNRATSDLVLDL